MPALTLTSSYIQTETSVSNIFLDTYMPLANGEFVKVYLCLLRMITRPDKRMVSLSDIADTLNHTENDIIRALKYWEKTGLLALTYQGDTITGITLLPISNSTDYKPVSAHMSGTESHTYNPEDTSDIVSDSFNNSVNANNSNNSNNLHSSNIFSNLSNSVNLNSNNNSNNNTINSDIIPNNSNNSNNIYIQNNTHTLKNSYNSSSCNNNSLNSINNLNNVNNLNNSNDSMSNLETATLDNSNNATHNNSIRNSLTQKMIARTIEEGCDVSGVPICEENFRQLLFITEQLLGKTLSSTDIELVEFIYYTLHFSEDLYEYLLEYCITNDKRSLQYIQRVAISWHEESIFSVEDARQHHEIYNKNVFAVMKAFGINNRQPAPAELDYILKWYDKFGFEREIVVEACNRTIKAIHSPNFDYADKILANWKKMNVHMLSDLEAVDANKPKREKFAGNTTTKVSATGNSGNTTTKSNNRFNNFTQRTYDFSEIEKKLIGKK